MIHPSKIHPPLIENLDQWPIAQLSQNRAAFVKMLVSETVRQYDGMTTDELKAVLTNTIFLERTRVAEEPWKVDPPKEAAYWSKMRSEVGKLDPESSEQQTRSLYLNKVEEIIESYSEEIVGTFKPKSFKFARKFLTFFFNALLNASADKKWRRLVGSRLRLYDRIKCYGPIDHIRDLFSKGTVVVVPTHFSNIDSVLVGYAMDSILGLPSFSYGAGLNLLNNGIVAYYINRMGAYRLDRRKKNPIYLNTLKQFSKLSIEQGVNSLFFTGGTRSRSGEIESSLKLGLVGTVIDAQRSLYQKNKKEKVFVVPLVMSYHFVLEAKFLIDQHLRKSGKEKYFKSKDQSYSIWNMLRFLWQIFRNVSQIKLSFGEPLDVLGYQVDKNGDSLDKSGNKIDLRSYFTVNNEIVVDAQRDRVYTKKLGQSILKRYHIENIVLHSHLVAFTLYHLIRKQHAEMEIYDFLRLDPRDFSYSLESFSKAIAKVKEKLIHLETQGSLKIANDIHELPIRELVLNGIKAVGAYHNKRAVKYLKKKNLVITQDLNLLLYYSNRLEHYHLEAALNTTNDEYLINDLATA